MTADEYLRTIHSKYSAPTGTYGPGQQIMNSLTPFINTWGGQNLYSRKLAGSYAKGTAVRGDADVDIFISLRSSAFGTLGDMYNNLDASLKTRGYTTRRQNVSIGISVGGFEVDLVPGWKQNDQTGDHSIFLLRSGSYTKTNIDTHILQVQRSGMAPEITLIKRWRDMHSLDFPSFFLELAVMTALNQSRSIGYADRVMTVLRYFKTSLHGAKITDPSNASNVVSDSLTSKEKLIIAQAAETSLGKSYWGEIIG